MVVSGDKLFLAYKESGLDSIVEFINSRASLFAQVYYHKTNRAFSSMLGNVCDIAKESKLGQCFDLFEFYEPDIANPENKVEQFKNFYVNNSDDYFLHEKLPKFVSESENSDIGEDIWGDLINRVPWSKLYESKIYTKSLGIIEPIRDDFVSSLMDDLFSLISKYVPKYMFAIDIMTDNAFKDVDKTEIKLLVKDFSGGYKINNFSRSGDKLDKYQSIKYFIRVFVSSRCETNMTCELIEKIEQKKSDLVAKFFGE